MRGRRIAALGLAFAGAGGVGCAQGEAASVTDAGLAEISAPVTGLARRSAATSRLKNRAAYVPAQCYATTRPEAGRPAHDPCYTCHARAEPPNYSDDEDLQLRLRLPTPALRNPWRNLFDPPIARAAPVSDVDLLAYVRRSNYFDADGGLTLSATLAHLPPEWDGTGNGKWDGFVPDAWFRFDDRGFDHRPDGAPTGWRALAYYPLPGEFLPTNGSFDDVLVRLDAVFREDQAGELDQGVYEVNLAIVEALVKRTDVAIDPVDEARLGVDLDLDGHLGRATRVAFDAQPGEAGATRMRYVGAAGEALARGDQSIAVGLFPTGTEFLHSVRYLDVAADGSVTMAARMKELRYMRKARWASYEIARAVAARDAREESESPDGLHEVRYARELGVYTDRGWALQGFIEDAAGALRPQTMDESAPCAGCHGELGGTTDGVFSMSRKLGAGAPSRGWFHWSQHDLRGTAEPRRADGTYEYTEYLRRAGGADDRRDNLEAARRFFDARGALRADAVARLHADVSTLLLPSASRALDLDRGYLAVVRAQSFDLGRDALLGPTEHAYDAVPVGESTGIKAPVRLAPLRP